MSILEQLNSRQREAASCTDSHVRIIAGAGSGKTRVVTVRIAYLIDECHAYPNRILAITFTNKAAREMRERVESMLGPLAASVRISTIHSFVCVCCGRISSRSDTRAILPFLTVRIKRAS